MSKEYQLEMFDVEFSVWLKFTFFGSTVAIDRFYQECDLVDRGDQTVVRLFSREDDPVLGKVWVLRNSYTKHDGFVVHPPLRSLLAYAKKELTHGSHEGNPEDASGNA